MDSQLYNPKTQKSGFDQKMNQIDETKSSNGHMSHDDSASYKTVKIVKKKDQRDIDTEETMKKLQASTKKSEILYFKNQIS